MNTKYFWNHGICPITGFKMSNFGVAGKEKIEAEKRRKPRQANWAEND